MSVIINNLKEAFFLKIEIIFFFTIIERVAICTPFLSERIERRPEKKKFPMFIKLSFFKGVRKKMIHSKTTGRKTWRASG